MFSQTTEYALRAMVCLAQSPQDLLAAPTLARQTGVPANYLAKVLQQLANAGLVNGRRGVGGGYRLAKPPGQISLLDIVSAMGTIRNANPEPNGGSTQDEGLRLLERKLREATKAAVTVFERTRLEELVPERQPS